MSLNQKMSIKHEDFIASLLRGKRSRGSGNQWTNPMDGRTYDGEYAFAWDCKSTLGKGVNVTRTMWKKALEQADGHRPMIPLRFYDNEALDVGLDLIIVDARDFAEILRQATT